MEFRPERFLPSEGQAPETDPYSIVFGFGRRACPGQVMGDLKVYLTIARFLACFNITKKDNQQGELDLREAFIPAILSHPKPFEVNITPRSPVYETLIRAVEVDAPWDRSHADEIREIISQL